MTNCSIKDCADESIWSNPTGKDSFEQNTVTSICDLYGSMTPLTIDWINILIF